MSDRKIGFLGILGIAGVTLLLLGGLFIAVLSFFAHQRDWTAQAQDAMTATAMSTATATSCPKVQQNTNIVVRRILEGQALVVKVPDNALQITVLFPTENALNCWAYKKALLSKGKYPGHALVVLEEDPHPQPNASGIPVGQPRKNGSWALVIVKGGNADATVMSISQAKAEISAYPDQNMVTERVNYGMTTGNDPA